MLLHFYLNLNARLRSIAAVRNFGINIETNQRMDMVDANSDLTGWDFNSKGYLLDVFYFFRGPANFLYCTVTDI